MGDADVSSSEDEDVREVADDEDISVRNSTIVLSDDEEEDGDGDEEGEVRYEEPEYEDDDVEIEDANTATTFVPDLEEEDGELDVSVYSLIRRVNLEWPCLSLDSIVHPEFDHTNHSSPYIVNFVAGCQAKSATNNQIALIRCRLYNRDDIGSDSDSSSSDDQEEEEVKKKKRKLSKKKMRNSLHCMPLKHYGICNRIRATRVSENRTLIASWSDRVQVSVYQVSSCLENLDKPQYLAKKDSEMVPESFPALYKYSEHASEGYGLSWSPVVKGQLASGDCSGQMHLWTPTPTGSFNVSQPYRTQGSIEDIQWSPNEATVLATCSTDRTVRVWDSRIRDRAMITVKHAHDDDVNVISWNCSQPFIVSGGEDSKLKVWDLRQIQKKSDPVALFEYHSGAINSVQWNPHEATQFAAMGADDKLSIWDLSLEADKSTEGEEEEEPVPDQLLFLHEGQRQMKELTWHQNVPNLLISTAADGIQVFRPSNL